MIEAPTSPRIQQAFHDAHVERARIFTALFSWLFKIPTVPLASFGLTAPSR